MKYQVMPELSAEEYQRLKEDIAANGVQVAVEYDEVGNILDGHHRVKACQEIGLTDWPKVFRVGMTEEEKIEHALRLNLTRRHLTREQKQAVIREKLKENPAVSDRKLADALGVSNSTVSLARKELIESGQVCESHTCIGSDGKNYPRQVERKPIALYNPDSYTVSAVDRAIKEAPAEVVQALESGLIQPTDIDTVRRHTPEQQIEIVRQLTVGTVKGVNQAVAKAKAAFGDTEDKAIKRLKGLFNGLPIGYYQSHEEVFQYLLTYGGQEFFNQENLKTIEDAAYWVGTFLTEFEKLVEKNNQLRRVK